MVRFSDTNFGGCYRGTPVLVTGHTGFKGAWLSLWLSDLGARVAGYSLEAPTRPNLFALAALEKRLEHHHGDVRDLGDLCRFMNRFQPRVVFHLAAQSILLRSYAEPLDTFDVNVGGTLRVLEAARSTPSVQSIVIITSDKCYEESPSGAPCREEDRLGGVSPYSASKGMAELGVASYRRSFFDREGRLGVATARAGNVIGGGDFGEYRLLPDCIRALREERCIEVRNPSSIRPWQFVLEPLSGYLLLGQRLLVDSALYSGAWNFGPLPSGELTVGEVVQKTVDRWGSGTWSEAPVHDPCHEARILRLDWKKAAAGLAWTPQYSLDEAIGETVAWYRAFHEGKSEEELFALSRSQIEGYVKRAREKGAAWAGGQVS